MMLNMPKITDEIVDAGERHYFANKGEYLNPYPIGSDEFNRFERGWVQALKKSEVGLLSRPPSETEFPIRSPSNTAKQPNAPKEMAERYRSRKG